MKLEYRFSGYNFYEKFKVNSICRGSFTGDIFIYRKAKNFWTPLSALIFSLADECGRIHCYYH